MSWYPDKSMRNGWWSYMGFYFTLLNPRAQTEELINRKVNIRQKEIHDKETHPSLKLDYLTNDSLLIIPITKWCFTCGQWAYYGLFLLCCFIWKSLRIQFFFAFPAWVPQTFEHISKNRVSWRSYLMQYPRGKVDNEDYVIIGLYDDMALLVLMMMAGRKWWKWWYDDVALLLLMMMARRKCL